LSHIKTVIYNGRIFYNQPCQGLLFSAAGDGSYGHLMTGSETRTKKILKDD